MAGVEDLISLNVVRTNMQLREGVSSEQASGAAIGRAVERIILTTVELSPVSHRGMNSTRNHFFADL
jgi:hypothetical protein